MVYRELHPIKSLDSIAKRNNSEEQRKERKVFIKVSFLKVDDINAVNGQFTADIFFQARWRELSLDHSRANANIKWESYWNPDIFIENLVTEKKHIKWNVLEADDRGAAYVTEKHRLTATLYKEMNLEMYPFDIQPLSIIFGTKLSKDKMELVEEDLQMSNVHDETFPRYHEWELKDLVEYVPGTSYEDENIDAVFQTLEVTCYAKRKSGFFIWNFFLIVTLNTLLSFTVFTVERSLPDFRVRLGFILLLSGVTFKFTISRFVPGIPYLTQVDKYIIANSVFVALTCIWHAITAITVDGFSIGDEEDKWAVVAFAIAYCVLQILYLINIVISGYTKWAHIRRMERKYRDKAKSLNSLEVPTTKRLKRKVKQYKRGWNE